MSAAYENAVLADTPAIYWPMSDRAGSTVVHDLSGNGRNGAVTGTPVTGFGAAPVMPGGEPSVSFDGTTGKYISRAYDAALDPGTGDFAVEFFCVLTNPLGNYVEVFCRDNDVSGQGFIIYLNASSGGYHLWIAGTNYIGPTRITDGKMHHLVVSRTSGTVSAWIDNVVENTFSASGVVQNRGGSAIIIDVASNTYPQAIGRFGHFAWYSHALSSARVGAHYLASRREGLVLG